MKELRDLISAWRSLPPNGKAVLATVVATTGSTYRKPGARMLITEAGWEAGSVSGGCLESDVLTTAWERTATGPAVVLYDSTMADDIVWGFGLGCQGSVTVLFERLEAGNGVLTFLAGCVDERVCGVIATVISEGPNLGKRVEVSEGSASDSEIAIRAKAFLGTRGYCVEDGVLYEAVRPPLALTIFGAGHDAQPLAHFAVDLGWEVTVVDHRQAFADQSNFIGAKMILSSQVALRLEPDSAVVVMSHNYERDVAVLGHVLSLNLMYVGQLGPRARTDRMLSDLARNGMAVREQALRTLYAPAGLDLGSSSPEEIALAIIAEIQAVLNTREGASLRSQQRKLSQASA